MQKYEQTAMEFIDAFGIHDQHLLNMDATKMSSFKGDSKTLDRSVVDWSDGYLVSPDRDALIRFDEGGNRLPSTITNTITENPVRVAKCDATDYLQVYCYANKQGNTSVVRSELAERATQIFGYEPDESTQIRVHPDVGTSAVMYCHPRNSTYIAISSLLDEFVRDIGVNPETIFDS